MPNYCFKRVSVIFTLYCSALFTFHSIYNLSYKHNPACINQKNQKTSMVFACQMLCSSINRSICSVDISPKDWIKLCDCGDNVTYYNDIPNLYILYSFIHPPQPTWWQMVTDMILITPFFFFFSPCSFGDNYVIKRSHYF